MDRKWHILLKRDTSIIVAFILSLCLSVHGHGGKSPVKKNNIAVMPFAAFTIGSLSFDFTHLIRDRLIDDKFSLISQDMLEAFLVEKRVRRTDFLDRATIREMGMALNADALIIGSVDVLAGGENPRIAMSAQMIDCEESSVVWANSISYTGEDFAGFLGIGKINSLQRLAEIAVTDLLKGLPTEVRVNGGLARPFEIVQASFFPKVLKGGQTTNVSIEVRKITGKPKDIRAFVLDTEIVLKTEAGEWYAGTLTAPTIEGVYPLRVYVTAQDNTLFSMDDLAELTVDNTPPEFFVSFRQKLISPNNDGKMDDIMFFPEILKADTIESWRVEITNEAGTVVRSEESIGSLPGGFIWRGENNKYKRVKDGTYSCQLLLEDKAGNRSVSPKEAIVVDTTPPEVDVVLAAEDDTGITVEVKTKEVNKIEGWELIIFDKNGNKAGKFEGKGDIPATLNCTLKQTQEGPSPEKEGFLTYSLEISDIAGNRLEREKEPLKPPRPEEPEREPSEKKEKLWVDDF